MSKISKEDIIINLLLEINNRMIESYALQYAQYNEFAKLHNLDTEKIGDKIYGHKEDMKRGFISRVKSEDFNKGEMLEEILKAIQLKTK